MAQSVERPATGSVTVTIHDPSDAAAAAAAGPSNATPTEVITLRLAPRKKKKVTWKPGTVDNEFLNKKSSKKCCIFHKDMPFDEDDSDEEECHGHDHHDHDKGSSNEEAKNKASVYSTDGE